MEKKNQQSTMYVDKRKAHKDAIVSCDVSELNNDLLATASDDRTIRYWDLRMNSSIKQFVDPGFKNNDLSHVKISPDGQTIFAAASQKLFAFDLKTDKVLINECQNQFDLCGDDINQIQISYNGRFLVGCDDSGNSTVHDIKEQKQVCKLTGQHDNITFTTEFINPNGKEYPMCVTSGFDSKVILWELPTGKVLKKVNINEVCQKHIPGQLLCPPMVYNITARKSSILLSVETGHILGFNYKELQKPKYIIDAHLGKVLRTSFARFNENTLLSVSNDLTFALWDVSNRDSLGSPSFQKRVEIFNKPNWIESHRDRKIIVADVSEYLYIYSFKD